MSPHDFRRMVLAWELVPQGTPEPDGQERSPIPDDRPRPSQERLGSSAINQEQPQGA